MSYICNWFLNQEHPNSKCICYRIPKTDVSIQQTVFPVNWALIIIEFFCYPLAHLFSIWVRQGWYSIHICICSFLFSLLTSYVHNISTFLHSMFSVKYFNRVNISLEIFIIRCFKVLYFVFSQYFSMNTYKFLYCSVVNASSDLQLIKRNESWHMFEFD